MEKIRENIQCKVDNLKKKISRKPKEKAIKFSDYFWSERVSNLFGLSVNFSTGANKNVGFHKKLFYLIGIFGISGVTILCMMTCIIGIRDGESILGICESCTGFSVTLLAITKLYTIYYLKPSKVNEVIEFLERYYSKHRNDPKFFKFYQNLKNLKFHQPLILFYGYAAGFMLAFMPLLKQLYGLITSKHFSFDPILLLYTPFDQRQPFARIMIDAVSAIYSYFTPTFIVMTDLLYIELVALTTLQFNILSQKIKEINPENGQKLAMEKLKELKITHQELIQLIHKMNEIFSPVLFVDAFGLLGATCLTSFLSFAGIGLFFSLKYVCVFLGTMVHMLVICHYGNILSSATLKISDDVYNCNWISGDKNFRNSIQLIMLRSQKAQILTGLGLADATLGTFQWYANVTFSYYSILVAIYKSS